LQLGIYQDPSSGTEHVWNGRLYDVRFYSRALSTRDVVSIHGAAGGGPALVGLEVSALTKTIADWDFDGGSSLDEEGASTASAAAQRRSAALVSSHSRTGGSTATGSTFQCTLQGTARVSGGSVVLDGAGHADCGSLPQDLTSFTIEAWVSAADDHATAGGGAVISIAETKDSTGTFDAITFGELHRGEWLDSSDGSRRTITSKRTPQEETSYGGTRRVHLVLAVDAATRTRTLYKDGYVLRSATTSAVQTHSRSTRRVLIGCRHPSCSDTGRRFRGAVHQARVYSSALSAAEVIALHRLGAAANAPGLAVGGELGMLSGPRLLSLAGNKDLDARGGWRAECDMDTDGGGWTRFWWYHGHTRSSFPSGESDVLKNSFGSCDPATDYCFSKMPAFLQEESTQLMARDSLGTTYIWTFDPNNDVAHRAWLAFS